MMIMDVLSIRGGKETFLFLLVVTLIRKNTHLRFLPYLALKAVEDIVLVQVLPVLPLKGKPLWNTSVNR
jgi:hypothetical protein